MGDLWLKVYQAFDKQLPNHPLVKEEIREITAGQKLPPLVDSAQAGTAEALYGIGASIGRRGGEDLTLIYLQLALYLQPSHGMALLSLADLYERLKKPDLAIKAYDRIPPTSPLHPSAEIQSAIALNALNQTDEAKKRLDGVLAKHPKDTEALIALGNIERVRKDFASCADSYGKAIAALGTPVKANWVVFYFRGICYERSNQWPQAETAFKKALQLYPNQPLVLNYLGYSWVDKGIHLGQGMDMIRRAVEQRPDDGFMVDSLGWAYYRIGDYAEAVKNLERAVQLEPADAALRDHLGDANWRIGQNSEARAQWAQARDLKPPPESLAKIEEKLKFGLPKIISASDGVRKALSGKRVALVIGNSDYVNVPSLANPANDARLMADTLRSLGFTLVGGGAQLDLNEEGFRHVVEEFGKALQGADVGLFYYAGHGVQVGGDNYLVPVDANPTKEADVDFQMLDANSVLRQMQSAGTRLNLVFLDACRNNPFGRRGLRSTDSGLAIMRGAEGTIISFATQPGSVAQDGRDGHSPYTEALVKIMREPDVDIFHAFNEIGLAVSGATGGAQEPWFSSSPFKGDFYFIGAPTNASNVSP
jgi:tetratricopeptide (TPR) repeat protein